MAGKTSACERGGRGKNGLGAWDQYSVLIVDDEEGMRSFLARTLAERCGRVETAASAEQGQQLVNRFHFDLLIVDIALPGRTGVEWLAELRDAGLQMDVILITAYADLDAAIGALRAGASDFILKPFRVDQILNAIKRCFDRAGLARENFLLRREIAQQPGGIEAIAGRSAAIEGVRSMVRRLAPLPTTVLLAGETGTGKELVARALHDLSSRARRAFVPVNCAAIAGELIESELFGHVKGAFTGATETRNGLFYYAQGGTLFLDEISELPLGLQTKLLRVLEDRCIRPVGSNREVPVDVRIIAASNRPLGAEAAAGRFRPDLYYRLDIVNISIPPLRERSDDVAPLAEHFAAQVAAQLGLERIALTPEIIARLERYHWPGNARELRNLIERSTILGYFPLEQLDVEPPKQALPEGVPDEDASLDDVERRHILAVLEAAGGNKSEAARRLGVSRKTLERKCAAWGVKAPH